MVSKFLGGALLLLTLDGGCRLGFDLLDRSNTDAADPDAPPGSFVVGGTITGLAGPGLVLQNNGADDLAIANDGPFAFPTPVAAGMPYEVTVLVAPSGDDCLVANGTGTVSGSTATAIEVTCFPTGGCPASPITFTTTSTFTVPAGCSSFTVDAQGGGGAGGAKNKGSAAAAGGRGGHAVRTLAGQTAGTQFTIVIGGGGTCASTTATPGGYAGGRGGSAGGSGAGGDGVGSAPPGGLGGAGSTGVQPGGPGGNGGFGGGGGGGGGDTALGNSGGGATTVAVGASFYVVAGGGGGAGAADQNGDVSGAGGAACAGYNGANGAPSTAGNRSAGGGGGGGCTCLGMNCDVAPTPTGGAGGTAGTVMGCTAQQDGADGRLVISFP